MGDKMGVRGQTLDEWIGDDSWAEEIRKEIDREILETVKMTSEGWEYVTYSDGITYEEYQEVSEWIDDNIKGPTKMANGRWWFKNPQDKVLFLLRWSEWL